MLLRLGLGAGIGLLSLLSAATAAEPPTAVDPYWDLVHDQVVQDDLKLAPAQQAAWRAALDPLDLRCFPLRNQSAEAAQQGLARIVAEAKAALARVLRPGQAQRLAQIVVRVQGTDALLRDDVAAQLNLTSEQRKEIGQTIADTRAGEAKAQKELIAAKISAADYDKELARLKSVVKEKLLASLTEEQKTRLGSLMAKDFDPSRLGRTAFKTPDLVGGNEAWLNSQPLTAAELRGRVVVVHFFAFACINCVHNYPSYRKWHSELADKGVLLVGIHTPETMAERNVETLKNKLQAERLEFPILVDNEQANWNAWGNGVWPAVYLLDKQGYLRAHWPGELKWQGRDGEAIMEQKVEQLLAEK